MLNIKKLKEKVIYIITFNSNISNNEKDKAIIKYKYFIPKNKIIQFL